MESSIHSWNGQKKSLHSYLTDYQEFIPLLNAAASSKDVIQAEVTFTGVLSDNIKEIKKKNDDQVKKKQMEQKLRLKTSLKKLRVSPKRFKTL